VGRAVDGKVHLKRLGFALSGHGCAFGIDGDVSHADDSDLSVGVIGLRKLVFELGCEQPPEHHVDMDCLIQRKGSEGPLCAGAKHG